MSRRVRLSLPEARRLALAAQSFDRPRPNAADDTRHYRRALAAITVLQLDFVNVLVPAHFLMIWSRLGAYNRDRFENYLYDSGEHIEQWAHEASVVAASDWPLLAHRRRDFSQWKSSPLHTMPDRQAYLNAALSHVKENGETASNDLPVVDQPSRNRGDWHRSVQRWALEHHFGNGKLAVRRRLKNFQRVYDLPQRIVPQHFRETTVSRTTAQRELLRKASRALGVGTCRDLADYYRMNVGDVLPRLQELIEEGDVTPVTVEGWTDQAYMATDIRIPREIGGSSVLSPFDPLVWFRPRALRLFGLEYRIEIYVPAHKRRWGYYVLPFRVGDEITARVDLKAERKLSRLLVQNAHLESAGDLQQTAAALAAELRALANWLELDGVQVAKTSAFEKALVHHLK